MNNPLISIIVPVYNGETYLARCLDSLLDQTYATIEILVVNDGSQDRTAEILSQYEQYPQIKVFYQENKGLSDQEIFYLYQCKYNPVDPCEFSWGF